MLGTAAFVLRTGAVTVRLRQLLQSAQPVVDRRLRELHASRKLTQVQLGVGAPPARHLAQGRRQTLERAGSLQPLDGGCLAEARTDRLADVCGLEVEPPVHLPADL